MVRAFLFACCITVTSGIPAGAADLVGNKVPSKTGSAPPAAPQPAEHWAGFYAGAHAGYGFGNIEARDLEDGSKLKYDNTGLTGGVHAGYNFTTGPWVLGLEGEINVSGVAGRKFDADTDDFGQVESATLKTSFPWLASFGPRVGYSVGNALLYAAGGVAFGQDRMKVTESDGDSQKKTETRIGFSVGGGVEYALDKRWSVRSDYRYFNLGRKTYRDSDPEIGDLGGVRLKADAHTIRVGLTYSFGSIR